MEKETDIEIDKEKLFFESTQEFFDMWLNMYKATMGRFIEMPAIGPTREKSEKIMNGFSIFANLYTTWMDSNLNFQSVFFEAMRRTQQKVAKDMDEIIPGDMSPEKYKDFYKIWIETYSETFKEFLKSGHFASDLGKLTSHIIESQKFSKDVIEDNFLKPMNLPTKTEMDDINKELYYLKKRIKEVESRLALIK